MKRKNVLKICLFLFLALLFPKHAFAEDVTFSVEKSGDNLKPNQELTVNIKASVPQGNKLETFGLYFKPINSSGNNPLTYLGGEGANGVAVSQNGANIVIEGNTEIGANSNLTIATLRYKVNGNAPSGNVTLKLDLSKNCGSTTTCRASTLNLTIASIGTDATLKSLKIPNATLEPAFNKNVFEYKTTIKDLSQIDVNAEASDPASKIQISDNYKHLQKGNNDIKIVVTAENGSSKTYLIHVNLNLTPTAEELLKADATLTDIKIRDYKIKFNPDEKKYFLEVPNNITKLNITTKAKNPNATVKIDNPKLKIGKNTITIQITSEDKTKTDTYQIIVTRKESKKKVVKTCPDVTSTGEWITFYVTTFIVFSLGIVLGYFLCKKDVLNKIFKKLKTKKEKKKKEDEEIPEEIEEILSDTIELDSTKILEKAKKK